MPRGSIAPLLLALLGCGRATPAVQMTKSVVTAAPSAPLPLANSRGVTVNQGTAPAPVSTLIEPSAPIQGRPWACPAGSDLLRWKAANATSAQGGAIDGIVFALVGHFKDAVRSVSFVMPNRIATAGDEAILNVWDPCERDPLLSQSFPSAVHAVTSASKGSLAAGDFGNGRVLFWNALAGPPRTITAQGPGIKALALSPDGTRIAFGGFSKSATIAQSVNGRAMQTVADGPEIISAIVWSDDGKRLAVGDHAGRILLFDVGPRGAVLQATQVFEKRYVFSLAFAPDNETLVAGLGDRLSDERSHGNSVVIWDLRQKQPLQELHGHSGFVYSVAVSSWGLVASGSLDRTVRLWNLRTGALVGVLVDAEETVNSVAFSADGRFLAAGSGPGKLHGAPGPDNSVRLYSLAPALSAN